MLLKIYPIPRSTRAPKNTEIVQIESVNDENSNSNSSVSLFTRKYGKSIIQYNNFNGLVTI